MSRTPRRHTAGPDSVETVFREEWGRLLAVLRVVYLIFTESYAASTGSALVRAELADEAIRLARILHLLLPDSREVAGLLALLLLIDARRAARTDADGELVLLDDQDRSRWDPDRIREGQRLLLAALRAGAPPGRYALQAAIAAVHDEGADVATTDWRRSWPSTTCCALWTARRWSS